MPHIGRQLQNTDFSNLRTQNEIGDNSTTIFILDYNVTEAKDLFVFIDSVFQVPSFTNISLDNSYYVNGSGNLEFTAPPITDAEINIYFLTEVSLSETLLSDKVEYNNGSLSLYLDTQIVGFKNKIINGDFQVWQRGVSFSLAGNPTNRYTADRWTTHTYTGNTIQTTDVPSNLGFQYSLSLSKVSSQITVVQQAIEGNPYLLNGVSYTVSAYVKGSVDNIIEQMLIYGNGGTGETIYSESTMPTTTANEWSRISYTFTMDAVETNNTFWQIRFDPKVNSDNTLLITGVQVEEGSIATKFESRSYAVELALCQRYYQKTYSSAIYPGASASYDGCYSYRIAILGTYLLNTKTRLITTMRIAPEVKVYSTNDGAADNIWHSQGSTNVSVVTSQYVNDISSGYLQLVSSIPVGDDIYWHITADADF